MFILSKILDLVQIKPENFNIELKKAVMRELNAKYSNRIIPNLGLGIVVWDVLSIEDGLLRPSDGSVYYKVVFRTVVFKPFVGEILVGWISSCTQEGISVKTDFFDQIYIPKDQLFDNCYWNEKENLWVWRTDPESPDSDVYFDLNEKIQCRVEKEVFTNIKPTRPPTEEEMKEEKTEEEEKTIPPYQLLASCNSEGMGVISWWD